MKNRFYKKLTAFTAAAMLAGTVNAFAAEQVELTLDDSIARALEKNHAVTQSMHDVEISRWTLSQARRTMGPTISWSSQAFRIGGEAYDLARRTGLKYDYNYGNTLSAGMPLYNAPLAGKIEAAGYGRNRADLLYENTLENVEEQVRANYYAILQARNLVAVQQEAVNTLQEHLEQVNAHYRVGTVAKADVLATEVALANVQQGLVTAQNNYDLLVSQMNNRIGLPTDTKLTLKDEMNYSKWEVSLEDCVERALKARPDLAAARFTLKSAEANVKAARGGYHPTVSAAFSRAIAGEKAFEDNHTSANQWAAGVQLGWNIFDNGVTSANVNLAKATQAKAESALLQAEDGVRLEVQSAYLKMRAAEQNITTTKTAVTRAEEDYKIAQVRYKAGVGTNLDVMDAQEKLMEARTNYYASLYQYNTSASALARAIGAPVKISTELYLAAVEDGKTANKAWEAGRAFGYGSAD